MWYVANMLDITIVNLKEADYSEDGLQKNASINVDQLSGLALYTPELLIFISYQW